MKGLSPPPNGGGAVTPGGLRILVVESHALVGAALSVLLCGPPLAAAVEIVLDGLTAMARLEASDFNLVVCELSIPPRSAAFVISKLSALGCAIPVMLLSDAEEQHLLLDAVTSGAAGFFTKDCHPDEFLDGVSTVLDGHYAVGRKLMPGMLARLAGAKKAASSR
ncbi:MAG: response regulator transcription factor [Chloroflexi bacterium]|nr:MAG: response regulator transcription factor [Chloroflexota bacterium]TMC73066.1 MAG: response regulator transcription factor [Chloroflexota bacterium]